MSKTVEVHPGLLETLTLLLVVAIVTRYLCVYDFFGVFKGVHTIVDKFTNVFVQLFSHMYLGKAPSADAKAAIESISYFKPEMSNALEMIHKYLDESFKSAEMMEVPSTLEDLFPTPEGGKKRGQLVLDIDETLIYSSVDPKADYEHDFMLYDDDLRQNVYVFKRPGLRIFLKYVSAFYDVSVISTGFSCYCDPILDELDTDGDIIQNRFYNDRLRATMDGPKKDLDVLALPEGMPEGTGPVIAIGNDLSTFVPAQKENVIIVKPFQAEAEDKNDRELVKLIPFLCALADVPDVRSIIHRRNFFEQSEVKS